MELPKNRFKAALKEGRHQLGIWNSISGSTVPEAMAAIGFDWVLIDTGDLIVHIFRPDVRSFYNIERMWSFGENGQIAAGGNA